MIMSLKSTLGMFLAAEGTTYLTIAWKNLKWEFTAVAYLPKRSSNSIFKCKKRISNFTSGQM